MPFREIKNEEERINVETLPALREILEKNEDMMQVVAPDKALTEKWEGNDYTASGISTGATIYLIPQKGLAEHRDIAQMVETLIAFGMGRCFGRG